MTSILDVVDNFFGDSANISRAPADRLLDFGEQVRQFAELQQPIEEIRAGAQYLGGWPSANFLDVGVGVVQSSLLLTEQVLVKDPLSDWFSMEQYSNSHKLGSAPGWLNPGSGPNIAETRRFLENVIPALRETRPLVDSGLVVFAPMERVYNQRRAEIEAVHEQLCAVLLDDVPALAQQFGPAHLAHADSLRGMFVVAGGEIEQQMRRAFRTALFYFAREYVAAGEYGSAYCAPFDFERFSCASGLGRLSTGSDRARECILRSRLPVYQGLTPELLSSLHNDDRFAGLRADIHRIYSSAPIEDGAATLDAYIEDQERTHLAPVLADAEAQVDRGFFSRLGLSLKGGAFQLAAGIGLGAASGSVIPTILTAGAVVADQALAVRRERKQQTLWTALVAHSRSITDELPSAETREAIGLVARVPTPDNPWNIPEEPSMSVSVLPGVIRANWIGPPSSTTGDIVSGYQDGEYVPCPCGSALKYRFCCKEVDRRYRRDSRRSTTE